MAKKQRTNNELTNGVQADRIPQGTVKFINVPAGAGSLTEQPMFPFLEEGDGLQIFPNPVNNQAGIKWSGSFLGSATIKIIDATDVAVSSITVRKDQFQYQGNLELGALKSGMYILEVKMQNGKSLTEKFIKQ